MARLFIGLVFCGIAAFLFSSRFICAAIFGHKESSSGIGVFREAYNCVGPELSNAATVALVIGIIYILCGEFSNLKKIAKNISTQPK